MSYDVSKSTSSKRQTLEKGTGHIKILLFYASKDMYTPLFRCLSPLLAHISVVLNFGTLTSLGRIYVA